MTAMNWGALCMGVFLLAGMVIFGCVRVKVAKATGKDPGGVIANVGKWVSGMVRLEVKLLLDKSIPGALRLAAGVDLFAVLFSFLTLIGITCVFMLNKMQKGFADYFTCILMAALVLVVGYLIFHRSFDVLSRPGNSVGGQ